MAPLLCKSCLRQTSRGAATEQSASACICMRPHRRPHLQTTLDAASPPPMDSSLSSYNPGVKPPPPSPARAANHASRAFESPHQLIQTAPGEAPRSTDAYSAQRGSSSYPVAYFFSPRSEP